MSNLLPNDWEITTLEKNSQLITDGSHFSPITSECGFPIATVQNMADREINVSSCRKISKMDFDNLVKGNCSPEYDDVLFSKDGTIGKTFVYKQKQKIVLLSSIAIIRLKKNQINPDYCTQYLQSSLFYSQLENAKSGSAIRRVVLKDIKQLELPMPPLHEQQKIAAILTSVDDVIEKTQVQINKLKDLKTGMMQELLTRGVGIDGKPHTEFKDSPVGRIPKGWNVWTLDDMSEKRKPVLKTGPFGSSLKSSDFKEKGVPVINIQNLGVGKLETKNIYFVTNEKARELSGYSVSEGDLVFSRVADVGRSVVIPKEAIGWIMSSNLMRISTDKSKVDSKYLMYQLVNGPSVTLQLSQMVSDGGRQVVTGPTIKQLQFPISSITEQKMIVNKIDSIDYYLNEKVKKVAQLNAIKKALMQDLLTGKVRVEVE
ncbi:restriction endonuclease subunit S [Photobacterium piscicola]|uniref:restriction endonuclease subunit S n=1 Tax=Photobacterium piscicola TaxID=1378299 RepID=UPI0038D255E0